MFFLQQNIYYLLIIQQREKERVDVQYLDRIKERKREIGIKVISRLLVCK